jgi:hypothetical protein
VDPNPPVLPGHAARVRLIGGLSGLAFISGGITARKVFEVPVCTGTLLLRSIEYESERAPLRGDSGRSDRTDSQ